jgi:phosphoglycolate phosphatase
VVTNKATRFAAPLLAGLGLAPRAACLVYSDTTPHRKPHPAPLLHGAQACGVAPACCVYVGDDLRDVQAGRAAGMRTVAVTWGYADSDPRDWGADDVVDTPADLVRVLA